MRHASNRLATPKNFVFPGLSGRASGRHTALGPQRERFGGLFPIRESFSSPVHLKQQLRKGPNCLNFGPSEIWSHQLVPSRGKLVRLHVAQENHYLDTNGYAPGIVGPIASDNMAPAAGGQAAWRSLHRQSSAGTIRRCRTVRTAVRHKQRD